MLFVTKSSEHFLLNVMRSGKPVCLAELCIHRHVFHKSVYHGGVITVTGVKTLGS